MKSAPVLAEALGIVVGDRRSLYWHGALMAGGFLIILVAWPSLPLAVYLRRGAGPRVYPGLFLVTAIYLFVAASAFTFERSVAVAPHPFVRWIRFTPVGPGAYLAGRLLFHLIHTVLFVTLVTPFLAVAGALTGIPPVRVLAAIAFLAFFLLCYRCTAEGFRSLDRPTGILPPLLFDSAVVAYLLLTAAPAPRWSAAILISGLVSGASEFLDVGAAMRTLGLHVLAAAAGIAIAAVRMTRRDREETHR